MMPFVPWTRSRRADGAGAAASAVRVLREGNPSERAGALDLLYRDEAPRVYRYAMALGGNPAWAADATQEAFVALALRPEGFDPARGSLGAYLAGVARHALTAHWREARVTEPWAVHGEDADDEPGHEVSPESLLVRTQDTAGVWAALRQLAPAFREALVLVELQERPYAEAAAIAGIELNTLRTRLHRARLKLAALLNAAEGDLP
jgi:RNA polymerase sigma-70 factor (ECF subfamily)